MCTCSSLYVPLLEIEFMRCVDVFSTLVSCIHWMTYQPHLSTYLFAVASAASHAEGGCPSNRRKLKHEVGVLAQLRVGVPRILKFVCDLSETTECWFWNVIGVFFVIYVNSFIVYAVEISFNHEVNDMGTLYPLGSLLHFLRVVSTLLSCKRLLSVKRMFQLVLSW